LIKPDPEVIPINKPFISSSLNTFILIILLSLFAGLFTWSVASGWMNRKSLIAGVKPRWLGLISLIRGGKTQTSLPSSQSPEVPISQQPEEARSRPPKQQ
jgi:H+/Cl- antiporter ClcA